MKRSKYNLFSLLITFSLLPLFLSIGIVCATSSFLTKSNLERNSEKMLYVVSNNLAGYCYDHQITAINASDYYEYIDSLKSQNIEMAIIAEGMPCTTSIKNENDYRIRDIKLRSEEKDLKEGYYDKDVLIDGKTYYAYYTPIQANGSVVAMAFAGQLQEDVIGSTRDSIICIISISLFLVLVFFVVIFLFCKNLSKSFITVTHNIDVLARGDLHIQKERNSVVKEMDILLKSTAAMQKNMSDTIGNVKDVSNQLLDRVNEVTSLSSSSTRQAEQITDSIDQLSVATMDTESHVRGISEQMKEIGSCVNDISSNVEHLYNSSERILVTNNEACENMDLIMKSSLKSHDAVKDISLQIDKTNDSIAEIDKAVALIISISDQTNLLSLNASIEAARAGDAGKGFGVVAQEIRNLAEQSAQGAEMIKNLSQTIRLNSNVSVELANRLNTLILQERESIKSTQSKYERHSQDIHQSVEEIRSISEKTENLSKNKEKVIQNVEGLNAICEENTAGNEEVSENIKSIIYEVAQVNDHCDQMNRLADRLVESVGVFQN